MQTQPEPNRSVWCSHDSMCSVWKMEWFQNIYIRWVLRWKRKIELHTIFDRQSVKVISSVVSLNGTQNGFGWWCSTAKLEFSSTNFQHKSFMKSNSNAKPLLSFLWKCSSPKTVENHVKLPMPNKNSRNDSTTVTHNKNMTIRMLNVEKNRRITERKTSTCSIRAAKMNKFWI